MMAPADGHRAARAAPFNLAAAVAFLMLQMVARAGAQKMKYVNAMELYETAGVLPLEPIIPEVAPSLAHFRKWTTKRAIYKSNFVDLKALPGKKAYVDCGARNYPSSIGGWFVSDYPQSDLFDQIVGFEVMAKYFRSYARKGKRAGKGGVELHQMAVWTENKTVTFQPERKETFKMATINTAGPTGDEGEFEVQAIDFADFLQRRYTIDDFVVIKIDIEGAEYAVLDHLMETGAIDLVDDLYVEWHFEEFHGKSISQGKMRADAVGQLERLRAAGAFAHEYS